MRAVGALLFLLLAGTVGQAQSRPYTCSFSSPPLERPAPVLLGWPDIEREGLPLGVRRELRVHEDVAIGVPDYSLRLVDQGQLVTGEVLIYWPGLDFHRVTVGDSGCAQRHAAEARQLARRVRESQESYFHCRPVEVRPRIEGCRVSFTADPGWGDMLRQSDSLGIWTLKVPDSPHLVLDSVVELVLDGIDISVELRDQAGYRKHSYNSPKRNGASGEREVAAVWDLLKAIVKAARSQFGSKSG